MICKHILLIRFLNESAPFFSAHLITSSIVIFSSMVRQTRVQSQIESYQRLKKWYLIPPCLTLSIIKYGSRVKWRNPGKGVVLSPTPRCSSFWKGRLRVAFYYDFPILLCCLCITNNSMKHQSFVCTQLNDQTVLFLTIQITISRFFVYRLNVKQFHLTHKSVPVKEWIIPFTLKMGVRISVLFIAR